MSNAKSGWMIHVAWSVAVAAAYAVGAWSVPDQTPSTTSNLSAEKASRKANDGPVVAEAKAPKLGGLKTVAPDESGGLLGALFGRPTVADLDALARQALRDPNQITRRLAFSKLLESLTPENAEQIRAHLVDLRADREQWRDFNYAWGALVGEAAFKHPSTTRDSERADILSGWAAVKPNEALSLLENLPPDLEKQRAELTRSVVIGLSDTHRALATDLVVKLSRQGNKDAPGLMEIVANETLRADGPELASQWSDTLPTGDLKGPAMGQIAVEFARRDPEGAAVWATRHASEDYATRAIEGISSQWTARSPEAAVGWLQTLPAGNGQTAGLQAAFNDWEDLDPVGAGKYLLAMPDSPQRDTSISGFSNGYAWQNPQLAIEWAGSIGNPDLRQRTLTRTGQIFFRQNPEAANAWLATSGLPPEVQQQIKNPPRR